MNQKILAMAVRLQKRMNEHWEMFTEDDYRPGDLEVLIDDMDCLVKEIRNKCAADIGRDEDED